MIRLGKTGIVNNGPDHTGTDKNRSDQTETDNRTYQPGTNKT